MSEFKPSEGGGSVPLVRCIGVTKFFGGVRALARVSFDLWPGEILGIVGDNGAGKSTLAKVLSGVITPDEGELWFGDVQVHNLTPKKAREWGVEEVYQNLELCDTLDAPANVMLGQEPVNAALGPFRFIDTSRAALETRQRLAELGVQLPDLKTPVRRLSGGQRQAIAIARATIRGHRLVIFDEPTAALGVRQREATLQLIKNVASQGVAVIVISHNLDEVFSVCHRILAMYLGELTLDTPPSRTTRHEVRMYMSGLGPGIDPGETT
jgi:simple sugar transport system ATP-binding protein